MLLSFQMWGSWELWGQASMAIGVPPSTEGMLKVFLIDSDLYAVLGFSCIWWFLNSLSGFYTAVQDRA